MTKWAKHLTRVAIHRISLGRREAVCQLQSVNRVKFSHVTQFQTEPVTGVQSLRNVGQYVCAKPGPHLKSLDSSIQVGPTTWFLTCAKNHSAEGQHTCFLVSSWAKPHACQWHIRTCWVFEQQMHRPIV